MFVLFCFSITLQCPYCRNEYDMQAIEQLLITNVQEKSMASVLQDVVCSKCNGVSAVATSGVFANFLAVTYEIT